MDTMFLLIQSGGQWFGVPVQQVRHVTRWQGDAPVTPLCRRLSLPEPPLDARAYVLHVAAETATVQLAVDEVGTVQTIPQVLPLPPIPGGYPHAWVLGVAPADPPLILLNLAELAAGEP